MEDSQIIELYWSRDERAIAETQASYGTYCFSIADRVLANREDSEECVQDTWMRAWNAIPPQRPGVLRMFLAKITRNLALDKVKVRSADKRGGGELPLVLDELENCLSGGDVESHFEMQALEAEIRRFLATLPQRERDVFLRRYFFVDGVDAIARRYGLREGTIRVILHRTRQKLKDHLRQEGFI